MRLLGLKKSNFAAMILLQSTFFVIPSIICGILLSIPMLAFSYNVLISGEMGFNDYNSFPDVPAVL